MIVLPLLAALALQQVPVSARPPADTVPAPHPSTAPLVFNGRDGNTTVQVPRFEGAVTIDGDLGESQWEGAARLTGFSQFNPVDGRASRDSTVAYV